MFEEAGMVNKIITAGIIGMIGWILLSVTGMSTKVAVIETKLEAINNSVVAFGVNNYTQTEATADKAIVDQRLILIEAQTDHLEKRVRDLENELRDIQK